MVSGRFSRENQSIDTKTQHFGGLPLMAMAKVKLTEEQSRLEAELGPNGRWM